MINHAFLKNLASLRNANSHKASRFSRSILILMCYVSLTACRQTVSDNRDYSQSYPPEDGGTLIGASIAEPSGMIFMVNGESPAASFSSSAFNTLLTHDGNLNLKGELAERWEISPDKKTITFTLKPNLKWADGKPLTSADVYFTWAAAKDPKTGSPYAPDFEIVKEAKAPDDLTFSVTYDKPFAPALDSWSSLFILPKHLLEGQDLHTTSFQQKPVSSSYYSLEKWEHGQTIQLKRNPLSVLGQARIETQITRIIPDSSAQFLELMAGNLDTMSLSPIQYSRVFPARPQLNQNFNRYKELGSGYMYLGFNLRREPFKDVRVRKAINYAIDKQEIIDGVFLGLGNQIASPYKPGTRWSNPDLKPVPYDPAKARQLLKEAGFMDSNGDGILERDGKPLAFEIITNQNKDREKTGVLIIRKLREIGIDATIRPIEWASFISNFVNKSDFDAVILGWGLGLDPDQYLFWHSSQQDPGKFNFIGYSNPKVDALLDEGRHEMDWGKREKIYHELSAILLVDCPVVYLNAGYGLSAIHKRVQGIVNPIPPAGVGYDSQLWYIPSPLRRAMITDQD